MAMERKAKKSQPRTKSDLHCGAKLTVGELHDSSDQNDESGDRTRQLQNQTTINSNQ